MKRFLSSTLVILVCLTIRGQVATYEWPEKDGPIRSDAYEVSVRAEGDTVWQHVEVLRCDVDLRHVQQAAFAEFDMEGTTFVRIRKLRVMPHVENITVRPSSRGVESKRIDDGTIEICLHTPEYLSVEFDGDCVHNLHLFANPKAPIVSSKGEGLEAWGLSPLKGTESENIIWQGKNAQDVFVKDARFIYFGPGVHKPKDLPSEEIKIPSNCMVYLAPGAVVKARLIVDHAENVCIIGRGILDHPLRGIEITFSKNVLVDGLTVLNPRHYTVYGGQSEGITIRHLKSFSCTSWSDGIDLMCCRDVRIEDVFLRNSDDCIALYNHRWWYWGGTENISVCRATLWADVAHPVNIGSHGDDRSEKGETLRGVRITDCDVLYARTNAVLNLSCGDKNWIHDVLFRDIRVERVDSTALIGLAVVYGAKYNRAPGNGIDHIAFENIRFTGDTTQLRPDFFQDYDATRCIGKHIVIK